MLETLDIILLTKNSSECHSKLWLKFDYSIQKVADGYHYISEIAVVSFSGRGCDPQSIFVDFHSQTRRKTIALPFSAGLLCPID